MKPSLSRLVIIVVLFFPLFSPTWTSGAAGQSSHSIDERRASCENPNPGEIELTGRPRDLIRIPSSEISLSDMAKAVSAGGSHTGALTSSGGFKCCGANGDGELSDGTFTQRSTPVDVSGLSSGVTALAAGSSHTCALACSSWMILA